MTETEDERDIDSALEESSDFAADGQYLRALTCLFRAVERHPDSSDLLNALGVLFADAGLQASEEAYSKGISYESTDATMRFNRGLVREALEKYDDAVDDLRLAVALDSSDDDFHAVLARVIIKRYRANDDDEDDYADRCTDDLRESAKALQRALTMGNEQAQKDRDAGIYDDLPSHFKVVCAPCLRVIT